jgi:hypothetical protein
LKRGPASHRDGSASNPGASSASRDEAAAALHQALALSQELLQAVESGDAGRVSNLDAERRRLLQSVRPALQSFDEKELTVLRTIADLNARSLGQMEHRFRSKCRDMDMLAAGRRAVRAYGSNRT